MLEIRHPGYFEEGVLVAPDGTLHRPVTTPDIAAGAVVATRVEVHGEHLAFLNSNGELAGLFLFESVESWSELPGTDVHYIAMQPT